MKYMGSKARFTKQILPIILKDRKPEQWYVEPFAGGMNVICEVDGNRIANDKNEFLIAMWDELTKGTDFTKVINKDLYDEARNRVNGKEPNKFCINCNLPTDGNPCSYKKCPIYPQMTKAEIGWIGWMASFNGRFFDGGYSGRTKTRNYIDEQIRNTLKQVDKLKGVVFSFGDYDKINIPNNSIIYCDPPYKNTKQYATSKNFSHTDFFEWCREMSKKGHTLYVSEYEAPNDFECVWEIKTKSYMKPSRAEQTTEKLFKFSPTNVR